MSCSVSRKTSERKVELDMQEKSDIEKEIELVEIKANSSKAWAQFALLRKNKYELIASVMAYHIAEQWDLVENYEQFSDMDQDYNKMKTFENISKVWTKIFEERKEIWFKNIGDLAIKKAIANTDWNKF